jgi:hypothetical protein
VPASQEVSGTALTGDVSENDGRKKNPAMVAGFEIIYRSESG